MRTEYKTVTVEQDVYISDDGKEFLSKRECLEHEYELLKNSIECYDYNLNKSDTDECDIVNLKTEGDVKNFIKVFDEEGYCYDGIDKPGLYIYGCCDVWINVDELISKLRGEANDKN